MANTLVFATVLVAAIIQSAIAQYGAGAGTGALGSTPYGLGLGGLSTGLYDNTLGLGTGLGSSYGKIQFYKNRWK